MSSSSAQKSDQFAPFFFPNVEACNGEFVDISGVFHPVFKQTFDANGGVHFKGHFNANGEGVGQTTGTTYLWRDAINEHFNAAVGEVSTFHQSFKLIAKGGESSGHANVAGVFVINAQGDVTVDIFSVTVNCN